MKSMKNEPVKIGLVGLNFGAGMADSYIFNQPAEKFVKIVAVCDLNREKACAYAAKHQLPVFYEFDELLKNSEIEAILLMTPPFGRAKLIRKCIAAGKHVLTTKPFELDPDEALSVLLDAREKNIIIHLNSPAPLPSSDLAKIREWTQKYDLGRPVSGDWETYAMYNEKADGSWLDFPEKCPLAPIFRLGIYGINELTAIMGEVEDVEIVSSRIRTGRPTPDNAKILIKFKNGAIGSVYAALCIGDGRLYPAALTLHFEHGTITKVQERDAGTSKFDKLSLHLRALAEGKIIKEECSLSPSNRSGSYQFDNFCCAVRNGRSADEIEPEVIAAGIRAIAKMAKKEKESENVQLK